jgi:hypothetical protein
MGQAEDMLPHQAAKICLLLLSLKLHRKGATSCGSEASNMQAGMWLIAILT